MRAPLLGRFHGEPLGLFLALLLRSLARLALGLRARFGLLARLTFGGRALLDLLGQPRGLALVLLLGFLREPRRFVADLLLGFLAGAPFRVGARLGLLAREPFAAHALVGLAREPRGLFGVLLLGGFTGLALGIGARLGLFAGAALGVRLLFRLLACLALGLRMLHPLGQFAGAGGVCLGHVPLGFGAEPSLGLGLLAHPRFDFARQALRFRARQTLHFESPLGFLAQLAFRLLA